MHTFTLGIDIGPWHNFFNWQELYNNGVRFIISKATQGNYRYDTRLPAKIEAIRKTRHLIGLYHWLDPLNSADDQAAWFLEKTKDIPFQFAALDVEQNWADWKQWSEGNITKFIPPAHISTVAYNTALKIKAGLQGRPLFIYTRASFIKDSSPQMAAWMPTFPLWIAHWLLDPGHVVLSWEELQQQHFPTRYKPILPPKCTTFNIWQWSGDRFVLPGTNNQAVDLDVFNGTIEEFEQLCNVVNTPQSPTLEQRVQILEKQALAHGWELSSES